MAADNLHTHSAQYEFADDGQKKALAEMPLWRGRFKVVRARNPLLVALVQNDPLAPCTIESGAVLLRFGDFNSNPAGIRLLSGDWKQDYQIGCSGAGNTHGNCGRTMLSAAGFAPCSLPAPQVGIGDDRA